MHRNLQKETNFQKARRTPACLPPMHASMHTVPRRWNNVKCQPGRPTTVTIEEVGSGCLPVLRSEFRSVWCDPVLRRDSSLRHRTVVVRIFHTYIDAYTCTQGSLRYIFFPPISWRETGDWWYPCIQKLVVCFVSEFGGISSPQIPPRQIIILYPLNILVRLGRRTRGVSFLPPFSLKLSLSSFLPSFILFTSFPRPSLPLSLSTSDHPFLQLVCLSIFTSVYLSICSRLCTVAVKSCVPSYTRWWALRIYIYIMLPWMRHKRRFLYLTVNQLSSNNNNVSFMTRYIIIYKSQPSQHRVDGTNFWRQLYLFISLSFSIITKRF